MKINRRNFLKASWGLAVAHSVAQAHAATPAIIGNISLGTFPSAVSSQEITGLKYNGDGFESLQLKPNMRLRWVLSNTNDFDISVELRGLRAEIYSNGQIIMGSSFVISAGATNTIEFTPPDEGSFFAAISGLKYYGAIPIIVQKAQGLGIQDQIIAIHDHQMLSGGFEYSVNNGLVSNSKINHGQVLRLRLINATRTGLFPFILPDSQGSVVAIDGHAIAPYAPYQNRVTLGPGQRVDIAVPISTASASHYTVTAGSNSSQFKIDVAHIIPSSKLQLNTAGAQLVLPNAKVPQHYQLANAQRMNWSLASDVTKPPLFETKIGKTVVITFENTFDFPVIVHSEGHCMRQLDGLDDGMKPYVRDSIILLPKSTQKYVIIPELLGKWKWIATSPHNIEFSKIMKFSVVR